MSLLKWFFSAIILNIIISQFFFILHSSVFCKHSHYLNIQWRHLDFGTFYMIAFYFLKRQSEKMFYFYSLSLAFIDQQIIRVSRKGFSNDPEKPVYCQSCHWPPMACHERIRNVQDPRKNDRYFFASQTHKSFSCHERFSIQEPNRLLF